MNRILDIDEKNMIAVVEPYVICAQVQAEALKRGLNLHIIGAGCGTSPLASCTSMDGTGWTGLSTGYNSRNVLGVEWVLPDGEVLRLGSPGSGPLWFCGDGPGPSLRGIMRGLFGARSALGVFTKCAIKLFPWNGPPQPEIGGTMMDLEAAVPDNQKVFLCLFPSLEAYADFAYGIADAEIGFMLCKNSIGLIFSIFMPRLLKKLARSGEPEERLERGPAHVSVHNRRQLSRGTGIPAKGIAGDSGGDRRYPDRPELDARLRRRDMVGPGARGYAAALFPSWEG